MKEQYIIVFKQKSEYHIITAPTELLTDFEPMMFKTKEDAIDCAKAVLPDLTYFEIYKLEEDGFEA
jgi:hypothetical protein